MDTEQLDCTNDPGDVTEESLVAANKEALEYLENVDLKTIGRVVFNDYLVTVSDAGKEIGELTVSVEEMVRDGEICFLVHAHSHGVVDAVPCGTSVTTYLGRRLVTLEQTQHEYMKIPGNFLDKKSVIYRQSNDYIINTTITEGEKTKQMEQCIPAGDLNGFISEGSNVLLQRIFALRGEVPRNAVFPCLNTDMNLSLSSYVSLGRRMQSIEGKDMEVYGVKRKVFSEGLNASMTSWETFFLPDGHMSSRTTVGSPVVMKLINFPSDENHEVEKEFERRDLKWDEDMEMRSFYLERKDELSSDNTTYVRNHPELNTLMSDFLQFLLLRKPDDVCKSASEFFSAFSIHPRQGQK